MRAVVAGASGGSPCGGGGNNRLCASTRAARRVGAAPVVLVGAVALARQCSEHGGKLRATGSAEPWGWRVGVELSRWRQKLSVAKTVGTRVGYRGNGARSRQVVSRHMVHSEN